MQSVRQLTFGCYLIPVLIWIMVLNHPYNLYRNTAWFFTTVSLPRGMMCSCCTLSVSTFAVVVSCLAFSARVLSTFEYTEQELNCSLCLSKNLFCLGIFLKVAAFSQWSTHTLLVQKTVCCKSLDRERAFCYKSKSFFCTTWSGASSPAEEYGRCLYICVAISILMKKCLLL